MPVYKFKNNSTGSLDANIGDADVTLTLETGEGALFPSPGSGEVFRGVLSDGTNEEWVTATGRAGDIVTMVRADTSYAFAIGSSFEHRLDDEALNIINQYGDYREVVTDPDGVLTQGYPGEEVLNTVTGIWWKSYGATAWQQLTDTPA